MEKEDWSREFQNLDEYKQEALSLSWKKVYEAIEETDRDWAKMEELRSNIDVNDSRSFSTAYKAFMEIYDPPRSGSALGLYLLETDKEGNYTGLEEFSKALGLGTPNEEKEINIDNILEH